MRLLIALLLAVPLWAQNNYAVDFNSAQSDKLYRALAGYRSSDGVGFITLVFESDQTANAYYFMSSSDEASAAGVYMLRYQIRPAGGGSTQIIAQRNNDTQDAVDGDFSFAANTKYRVLIGSNGSNYLCWYGVIGAGGNGASESMNVVTGSNTGDWYDGVLQRDNITVGCEKGLAEAGHFDGTLDELSVHNVAPTQALWEAIYNGGTPRDVTTIAGSGVVNYWRFEEGAGQYAFDSVGSDTLFFGDDATVEADDPAWVASDFGWDAGSELRNSYTPFKTELTPYRSY